MHRGQNTLYSISAAAAAAATAGPGARTTIGDCSAATNRTERDSNPTHRLWGLPEQYATIIAIRKESHENNYTKAILNK